MWRELSGLGVVCIAVILGMALYSANPADPTLFALPSKAVQPSNMIGYIGSTVAAFLGTALGLGAWLTPIITAHMGFVRMIPALRPGFLKSLVLLVFLVCLLSALGSPWASDLAIGAFKGGGSVGKGLFASVAAYVSPFGTAVLIFFVFFGCLQYLLGFSFAQMFSGVGDWVEDRLEEREQLRAQAREERLERKQERLAARQSEPAPSKAPPQEDEIEEACEKGPGLFSRMKQSYENLLERVAPTVAVKSDDQPEDDDEPEDAAELEPAPAPRREPKAAAKAKPKPVVQAPRPASDGSYTLPPLTLLTPPPATKNTVPPEVLRQQAQSLTNCLADFGISGEVVRSLPGPVVTMFEYKPAPGIKISRIAGLSDDLALAMKALAVRIEAPIPGKDLVGVEIPNDKRATVYLRDILESPSFADSSSKLNLSIGKDIQGNPFTADLARMPHLLVAGATGAGKSVCINGIVLSLLYEATPEQVKLLLIDPKRIELAVYADLPHLVHPVVTDMALAKSALDWAVHEMDQRYEAMAALGVRNIDSFNERVAKMALEATEDQQVPKPIPYLVIIIDELADLMMTSGKDVEICIVRLAQLARAAGIHLILATQRPSVDVVTGLIKANFPTRISFQVTSKHDSRTILDTVGAEHLLGRGDMLFKPSGGKMTRMHGAFVSDEETASVVEFWKAQARPDFQLDFSSWGKEGPGGAESGPAGAMDAELANDPIYPQAVEFVLEQGKASISLLQRRFKVGFNRAARYIEQMERDGLLGASEGAGKPRLVLRGRD